MALSENWLHRDLDALRDLKIQKIWNGPCQMNLAARLTLFSFMYGRAVARYVEIGTAQGGSALIANQAFELLGRQGLEPRGACIDRSFAHVGAEHRQELEKRFTFIETTANLSGVKKAYKSLRGHFDLALIDGGREFDQAVFDTMLLLPYMAPGAYMLLNWAAYPGVAKAIDYLSANTSLQPCGAICRHANLAAAGKSGDPFDRAGVYLMRVADDHQPVELPSDDLPDPALRNGFLTAQSGSLGVEPNGHAAAADNLAAAEHEQGEENARPLAELDRGEAALLRIEEAGGGTMARGSDEPEHAIEALSGSAADTSAPPAAADRPHPATNGDVTEGGTLPHHAPGWLQDMAVVNLASGWEYSASLADHWLHGTPSALYGMKINRIWNAPCQLNLAARLMLFSVIYGRAVTHYVEIGTAKGGSALIVNQAFELLRKQGLEPRGACIDRSFADINAEHRHELERRFTLIEKPANLSSAKVACKWVRGHFDCALIDGGRDTEQVVFDSLALMPFMAPGAYMLFHWAAYSGVAKAIDYLAANTSLQPCGAISVHAHLDAASGSRDPHHRGGLYLMRVADHHEPVEAVTPPGARTKK